jgi:hypothetical protein
VAVVLEEPLVKRRLNRALLFAVLAMYVGSLVCAVAGAAVFAAALTADVGGRGSALTRMAALGRALWRSLSPPTTGPRGAVPYLSMLQLPPADGNYSAGAAHNATR